MKPSFLQTYLEAFKTIQGWFQYDAALMFMAYRQLLSHCGVAGNTLEIGVHHGLSAIAIAALRGPDKLFCAVDLFEQLQSENVSGSGEGNRRLFEENMGAFYPDMSFVRVFARPSAELQPGDLGEGFSFCHVDGGHSRRETYGDLRLCCSILLPGGLIALDDYFNPEWPGVCEGAVEFLLGHKDALRPVAIGYGKVLFQKLPAPSDLNSDFSEAFPAVEHKVVQMWDTPTVLFTSLFRSQIDLHASTPQRLMRLGSVKRAIFSPKQQDIGAVQGQLFSLPVVVTNISDEVFPAGQKVFGLSYHLLSASGEVLKHDNDRAWILSPMSPGESQTLHLPVEAPPAKGQYQLEIDLVWENVMWFKDVGNPAALVKLRVD